MCDDWACFNFVVLNDAPKLPGVYFLMNNIELVYVGESKNIRSRLSSHKSNWNNDIFVGGKPMFPDSFDSLYYLECKYTPERKAYEEMFIDDYGPKLNGYDILRDYIGPKQVKEQDERRKKELLEKFRKEQEQKSLTHR